MRNKFTTLSSTVVPLPIENIDTDQIIPARFLKATTREGFGENLFRDWRFDKEGNPKEEFVMNSPKYKGQIFMLDSVRDALGAALIHLGYSVNSTDEYELEQAKKLLIKQKPLVQAYITDEMVDKMVAGEGLLTLAYSGEAAYALSLDDTGSLTYAVPKEGSNKWVDGFVVLKTAKQKELAMKFINFMCSKEVAQKNMIETGYVSPVLGTYPEEESDTEVYYPLPETLANCEAFTYSQKVTEKYSDIWLSVQLSN